MTREEQRRLSHAVNVVKGFSIGIGAFAALLLIWTVGPRLETALFPAVGKLEFTAIYSVDEQRSRVYARFNKLRAECTLDSVVWFRGTRDTSFERATYVPERRPGDVSSVNRPTGVQSAGPWLIGIPAEEIKTGSFAELYHRCHPFWLTKTEFYP